MSSISSVSISATGSPGRVLHAAAALRAELAAFDPRLLHGQDCARVAGELAATEKACAATRTLTAARAVDSGAHRAMGFSDGAAWLAHQSGVTNQQAKRDLEIAGRLQDCPGTRDALLAGDISLAQAAEITQAEADTPGVEGTLLPVARASDLTRLRDQARQQRQARTPVADLHVRQRRARFFRHWRDRMGMVCFAGQLPPEEGVPFIARIEQGASRARRAARSVAPAAPAEKWEAYAADALAGLCTGYHGSKRSARAELVVVCDLYAWRRGHAHPGEPCHIIGGGPIPVDLARELTGDAFVKAVLHDGTTIRTVRHLGRYFPVELRTALDLGPVPEFTGRQCADCGARWGLQYDHIDPVNHDGPTSYDNVQALCWTDHRAKTERDRKAGLLSNRRRVRPPGGPHGEDRRGIGPGKTVVEPGMTSGHTITVTPTDAHVEVRVGGELLAATDRAVILSETGLPDRYYLPREDVRMERLRSTSFHTTCPFKGEASYWSLETDGQTRDGIVWSYETPLPSVPDIEGMMSFYPDRAEVTVGGQALPA